MMQTKINYNDIEDILGFQIDQKVKQNIENFDLVYTNLNTQERDSIILKIIKKINEESIYSGKHRIQEWEKGWSENLELFNNNKEPKSLIPLYHSKYDVIRWKGDFVKSVSENLDYKLHICLVDSIMNHYINDEDSVVEFGCGPGYHLLRLSHYKKLNLYGADWTVASQRIISNINQKFNLNIRAFKFDFFKPDYSVYVPVDSVFYTVAALEQVGDNFKMFVEYVLEKKPKLVINMEPIEEVLDENSLVDYLSIKYFRKRNYLSKYLPYLEKLEREGKIEIIKKQRILYGSLFVEGHSLIVWRPKNN